MDRVQEQRIIARAQRGSAGAFREIVDAYKDRLYAFVWRMLRDHHESEDVCQTAFVKAYESLKSYSTQYAFSTWLFTIAYRVTLNRLRKRRGSSAGEADLSQLGSREPGVHDALVSSEQARLLSDRIWSAVDQLSPPQKGAVLLFYREGKNCQEIGEVLGIPAATVKSHLHRARERLRGLLSAEGDARGLAQSI
jgi:RNA polymerase sigma-70 factor (ECF subfamily)